MTRYYPYFSDNHEDIERVAYNMWQQAGRPYGDSDKFWRAAKEHLDGLNRQVGETKPLAFRNGRVEVDRPPYQDRLVAKARCIFWASVLTPVVVLAVLLYFFPR